MRGGVGEKGKEVEEEEKKDWTRKREEGTRRVEERDLERERDREKGPE